ncbi:hypothetical protein P153DRAFT_145199 [Dothidotthia symphoricarpi CBS 119687]|uniref:Uncharacterized protein n=1 Tax=Dothidotthia symphoricarpi CBS 119687 TaxID=1392245 RepID=A0A6A5ZWR3_9PLEO|nr:uncharacterized protein P153DRAFT_145199 [Dothidotthia symphoricarpi CBS 119687]KAF2123736.1 hypothetical protein P153DRAFT_145199 [Dothidotthia symphoricarpi CBS 119687]
MQRRALQRWMCVGKQTRCTNQNADPEHFPIRLRLFEAVRSGTSRYDPAITREFSMSSVRYLESKNLVHDSLICSNILLYVDGLVRISSSHPFLPWVLISDQMTNCTGELPLVSR